MTLRLLTNANVKHYAGTSLDEKPNPNDARGDPLGFWSSFKAKDLKTGVVVEWRWDGDRWIVPVDPIAVQLTGITERLDTMVSLLRAQGPKTQSTDTAQPTRGRRTRT